MRGSTTILLLISLGLFWGLSSAEEPRYKTPVIDGFYEHGLYHTPKPDELQKCLEKVLEPEHWNEKGIPLLMARTGLFDVSDERDKTGAVFLTRARLVDIEYRIWNYEVPISDILVMTEDMRIHGWVKGLVQCSTLVKQEL